ncbi:MAG: hypothetical protein AAF215_00040 [Cyanobacteria bacterium P01_A01_bin.123]
MKDSPAVVIHPVQNEADYKATLERLVAKQPLATTPKLISTATLRKWCIGGVPLCPPSRGF